MAFGIEKVERTKDGNFAYVFPENCITDKQKISYFVQKALEKIRCELEIKDLTRELNVLQDPRIDYNIAKSLSDRIYNKVYNEEGYNTIKKLLLLMRKKDLDPSSHFFIASALYFLMLDRQIHQLMISDIINFSYLENLHTESYSKVANLLIFICKCFKTLESKKALIDFYSNKYTDASIADSRKLVELIIDDEKGSSNIIISRSSEKLVIDFYQNNTIEKEKTKDLVWFLLESIKQGDVTNKAAVLLTKLIDDEKLSTDALIHLESRLHRFAEKKYKIENIQTALYNFQLRSEYQFPDYFEHKRKEMEQLIEKLTTKTYLLNNISDEERQDKFLESTFKNNFFIWCKGASHFKTLLKIIIGKKWAKQLYSDSRFPDDGIFPLLEVFIERLNNKKNDNDIKEQLNAFIDFVLDKKMQINPSVFASKLRLMINNLRDRKCNIPKSVQTFEKKLQEIDTLDRLAFLKKNDILEDPTEEDNLNNSTTFKISLLAGKTLELLSLHKLII